MNSTLYNCKCYNNKHTITCFFKFLLIPSSWLLQASRFYHRETDITLNSLPNDYLFNGWFKYLVVDQLTSRGAGIVFAPDWRLLSTAIYWWLVQRWHDKNWAITISWRWFLIQFVQSVTSVSLWFYFLISSVSLLASSFLLEAIKFHIPVCISFLPCDALFLISCS